MKLLVSYTIQEFILAVLGEVGFIFVRDTVNRLLLTADAGPLDIGHAIAGNDQNR